MRKTVFALICIFIVLFALANQCEKSVPDNLPPVEDYKTNTIMPAKGSAYDPSKDSGTNVCNICGKRFRGWGYVEVRHGEWHESEKPYQTFICSQSCGMQHTRDWETAMENLRTLTPAKPAAPSTRPTSGYSVGTDGRVYENEPCELCNGTGIESGKNMYSGETESRVCPMCDGKGKRSY